MAAIKTQTIRHLFSGGWATDYGPVISALPDQTGTVTLPFLIDAENVLFELDGGPHKIGGASKLNASAVASGAAVTGVYDYWKQGTVASPSRCRVIHAGTVCMADANNGVFANIFTGLTAGAIPNYSTFDDLLIIASSATGDLPKQWDQTTASNLAGSPPNFAFSCYHKNRQWASGNPAAPSRLYYSINVDPTNWVGAGSGSIDIDISDGDVITGIVSHQNSLFVFKGPNKGSIHRITGSSPTGSDAFARTTFCQGLGAAGMNSIFRFSDDIGFVSQYGSVHSLAATQNYGDFEEAALSRPINIGWMQSRLNYNRLANIWAAVDPLREVVYLTASYDSSTTNNYVIAMDYRLAPNQIRWSKIPAYQCASLGLFVDDNGIRKVLAGGNDGFVRKLNISNRSIDEINSFSYKVTTPVINYGSPMTMKTIERGSVGINPKGNYDFSFGWKRDNYSYQTYINNQNGGSVSALGTVSSNPFILGTSTLAGSGYLDKYMEFEEGGEFRGISYQITDNVLNADLEIHLISTSITVGTESTENA
jgi:hypothetical protein